MSDLSDGEDVRTWDDVLDGLLHYLKMHERRPCDDYAPSQRALAAWISSFCDLSA